MNTPTSTFNRAPSVNPLSFIDRLIAEVELTPTQYQRAKTSYEAVAEVLNRPGSPILVYTPAIYPQGSIRIGTTVRPWAKDEFDLDMLCWIALSGKTFTPGEVYQLVWDTLSADGTYRSMLEKGCRCIRIRYNDSFRFHLDVVPAIPDWNRLSNSLYVPDRERKVWSSTHPLGFADDFFKPSAARMPIYEREIIANAREFSAKSATVQPLPAHGQFDKTPLQRMVQFLKHDRNKYYQEKTGTLPSSILLTTLITHSYNAAVGVAVPSLMALVIKVVTALPRYIGMADVNGRLTYRVMNPVNDQENFAERWTARHYQDFTAWHRQVLATLNALEATRGRGADVLLETFNAKFGKDAGVRIANSLGVETRLLHETKQLKMDRAGKVGLAGALIPGTVNFGNP
jgi:Second Messenger Oligonucleotide or Dinucleotide Synthetase domain